MTRHLTQTPCNRIFQHENIKHIFKPLAQLITDVSQIANSKQAYIVGNSSTIKAITLNQWLKIHEGFSIGFNTIPLFETFQPDLWILEVSNWWSSEIGAKALESAKKLFDGTGQRILIKDAYCDDREACAKIAEFALSIKNADVYLIENDYFIQGNGYGNLRERYREVFGSAKRHELPPMLIRKRGSLSMAFYLCLIAKFKQINVLAAELRDSSYFYGEQDNTEHLTECRRYGTPISEVIRAMVDAFADSWGVLPIIRASGGKLVDNGVAEVLEI